MKTFNAFVRNGPAPARTLTPDISEEFQSAFARLTWFSHDVPVTTRPFVPLGDFALTNRLVEEWAADYQARIGPELALHVHLLRSGELWLEWIEAWDGQRHSKSHGVGTAAMHALTEYADAHGRRIVLTPTGSQVGRLTEWYTRFGFVTIPATDDDPTYMLRDPR